jgi:hypothetical protein
VQGPDLKPHYHQNKKKKKKGTLNTPKVSSGVAGTAQESG